MNMIKRQQGASILGWLIILLMVGVLGLASLKLAPVYLEYYSITQIMKNLESDASLKGAAKPEVAKAFARRLNISSITSMTSKDYKVKKVKGKRGYVLVVDYEVRKPLLKNLSIVASFRKEAEVGK